MAKLQKLELTWIGEENQPRLEPRQLFSNGNILQLWQYPALIRNLKYLKERGKITNKEYQEIAGVSKPTASRELAMLVSGKVLEQQGITGKGTFYILIKGSQTAQTTHKGLANGSNDDQRGS